MNLTDAQSILVFGGSFDPPHHAHVRLPMLVCDKLAFDLVAYVPAARPPHKLDQQHTPAHHRLAMLRLALADQPRAAIVTDELDRATDSQPSYTIDTLTDLRQRLKPSVRLRLLIGVDQLLIFDQWKDADRIVQLAEPVVMLRPPHTHESLRQKLSPAAWTIWQPRLVEMPAMDISSTRIRQRLAAGEPIDDLVPAAVARYINAHRLYR